MAIGSSRLPRTFYRTLGWLLPSFLSNPTRSSHATSKQPVRSTAWLDGLRGWASLIVYFYHFNANYNSWNGLGWGYNNNKIILSFPVVRTIIAGPGMVSLFFIVSGYSLAWGPLREYYKDDMMKYYRRLASSILRRATRLYTSAITCSFLVALYLQAGFFDYATAHYPGFSHIANVATIPTVYSSLFGQLSHWFSTTLHFLDLFRFTFSHSDVFPYIPPSWTIAVEFQSSLILFLTMMSVSHLGLRSRVGVNLTTIMYCMIYGQWAIILFLAGFMLAEYTILRETTDIHEDACMRLAPRRSMEILIDAGDNDNLLEKVMLGEDLTNHKRNTIGRKILFTVLFIFGLHLNSIPDLHHDQAFGYVWIHNYFTPRWWAADPRARFPTVIGSIIIIYCVSVSKNLQRFFSCGLSRYLGRISYALYLWHQSINSMFGFWIVPTLWKFTNGLKQVEAPAGMTLDPGRQYAGTDWFGFELGVFLGWILNTIMVVWVADLFTRSVDEPSVRLARRIENLMVRKI